MNLLMPTVASRILKHVELCSAYHFLNLCLHYQLKMNKNVQKDFKNGITLTRLFQRVTLQLALATIRVPSNNLMRRCPLFVDKGHTMMNERQTEEGNEMSHEAISKVSSTCNQ